MSIYYQLYQLYKIAINHISQMSEENVKVCKIGRNEGADKICISEQCTLANPYVCSQCEQQHQHNGSILAVRVAKINQVHTKINKYNQKSATIVSALQTIKDQLNSKIDSYIAQFKQNCEITIPMDKQLVQFESNYENRNFASIWKSIKANAHLIDDKSNKQHICLIDIKNELTKQLLANDQIQSNQQIQDKENRDEFIDKFSQIFTYLNFDLKNKSHHGQLSHLQVLKPNSKAELKIVAKLYQLYEQPEKALQIYNSILKQDSLQIESINKKALLLKKMKKYEEAYEELSILIGLLHDKASTQILHFHRGEVCREMGKYSEAMSQFNKCVGKQSIKSHNVDKAMAHVLFKQGKHQQALALFKKALTHTNLNEKMKIQIYEHLYQCAKATNNNNLALECLNALHKSKPQDLDIVFKRARQHHELKHYEKAINDYSEAIQKITTIPGLYYNRAVEYIFIGQSEQAIPDLKKAIQLDPNFKEAVHLLANTSFELLQKTKNPDVAQHLKTLAINSYGYSLNFYPNNPNIWHNLGVLQSQQQHQKAYQCFDKAIELSPNLVAAYLGRIKMAQKLHRSADIILKDVNTAIELGDRSLSTFIAKATLQEELKLFQQSLDSIQLILKADPENQKALALKERVNTKLHSGIKQQKPASNTQSNEKSQVKQKQ